MRVRDVMTEGVKTIAPTATAEDAWTLMRLHSIHHLVVTSVILSWSSLATSPVSSPPPQIKRGCGCLVTANRTHRRCCTGVSDVTVCGTLR